MPTIAPENATPGIKDLTNRLNEGYAYSYNVFMRDSGTKDIRDKQHIHEIAVPAAAGASPSNTAPSMQPIKIFEDDRVSVSAILVPHGPVFQSFAYRFDTDKNSGWSSVAIPSTPRMSFESHRAPMCLCIR